MARERLSLHVGINYPGTSAELAGCVNDAVDWQAHARDLGYVASLMVDSAATKAAILGALESAVARVGWGGRGLFTFSGHGTWVPDLDGDEADGRDEALCPIDYRDGLILDDDLHRVFSQRRYGSRWLIVSDSCHSGTVSRAMGSPEGARFLPPSQVLGPNALVDAVRVQDKPARGISRAGAVLLSGCADIEFSYDAWFGSRANGAMTRAAIDAYRPGDTYATWHARIREALPSARYPQTPQLGASWHQRLWSALT